jgi:hypothetical protein
MDHWYHLPTNALNLFLVHFSIIHTYLPTWLPTYLPTYLPTHLLPTYLPTYLSVSASSLSISIIYLSVYIYASTHLQVFTTYILRTISVVQLVHGAHLPSFQILFVRATSTDWIVARILPTQYNIITKMMQISMPRMGPEPLIFLFEQQKMTHAFDRRITAVVFHHRTALHLHFTS